MTIRRLDHPRIVHCVGAAWPKSSKLRDIMLVTEYVAAGDLRALLDLDVNREWPLTKIQYALHVAQAVHYLHAQEIVHRDLKAKNVLIDPNENGAKLCDFGVAMHLPTMHTHHNRHHDHEQHQYSLTAEHSFQYGGEYASPASYGFGTSRWMAPEVLTGDAFSKAADMYAFGIVLYELDSHAIPFANSVSPSSGSELNNLAILQHIVKGTLKLTFGRFCPAQIADMAERCFHPNPKARPTAAAVVATLEALILEHR